MREIDIYHWRAEYTDGSYIDEYDDDYPQGRSWKMIDQERLFRFILIPQRAGLAHHIVMVTASYRPIFYRRRLIEMTPEGEQTLQGTLHILGAQTTVNGGNAAVYTFYFPDGSTLVTDNYNHI